jgi:hypothetical protein
MSDTALKFRDAARALGVSESQLRRYVDDGAPVLRRGGRGRGRAALVDVEAIAAWRRSRDGGQALPNDRVVMLAAEIPELAADAVYRAFLAVESNDKCAVAGILAGVWYVVTVALLDRIRAVVPSTPDVETTPEKIATLREINERHGNVAETR